MIKTHSNVSCGPTSPGRVQMGVSILPGTTKLQFSCIHRSMTFYLKITKFAVELPVYKGRLDSKNWSKSRQAFPRYEKPKFQFLFFIFFLLLLLRLSHKSQNLQARTLIQLKFGTLVGYIQVNSGPILVTTQHSFTKIQTFICVYKDRTLDMPTG